MSGGVQESLKVPPCVTTAKYVPLIACSAFHNRFESIHFEWYISEPFSFHVIIGFVAFGVPEVFNMKVNIPKKNALYSGFDPLCQPFRHWQYEIHCNESASIEGNEVF